MDNEIYGSWSEAVVDSYNISEKKGTMIFNFNFESPVFFNYFIEYVFAYILWVKRESSMKRIDILFDIRGQKIISKDLNRFKGNLNNRISSLNNLEFNINFKT